jgi:nucleoside phosphorylase
MVGIGGAAPSSTHDIRLGDVVVSEPSGTSRGVIQYDRGKTTQEGKFQRTGLLNSPPKILLTALGRLKAEHEESESKIPLFISEMAKRCPKMRREYAFQGGLYDELYQATYDRPEMNATCEMCDPQKQVQREGREDTNPQIYYGNIASSNQVMKHGATRDQLGKELDMLCFKMEAAGLMPDFPCLVIRGIYVVEDVVKISQPWVLLQSLRAQGRPLLEILVEHTDGSQRPVGIFVNQC